MRLTPAEQVEQDALFEHFSPAEQRALLLSVQDQLGKDLINELMASEGEPVYFPLSKQSSTRLRGWPDLTLPLWFWWTHNDNGAQLLWLALHLLRFKAHNADAVLGALVHIIKPVLHYADEFRGFVTQVRKAGASYLEQANFGIVQDHEFLTQEALTTAVDDPGASALRLTALDALHEFSVFLVAYMLSDSIQAAWSAYRTVNWVAENFAWFSGPKDAEEARDYNLEVSSQVIREHITLRDLIS